MVDLLPRLLYFSLSLFFKINCNKLLWQVFLPSFENFKISCLLGSTEALGCFQFHFYGIWFLSASNMSPFTVHPINSWQVYKLLFKQCQPLLLPMTNIIQIELFFFFFEYPTNTWNKTRWKKACATTSKRQTLCLCQNICNATQLFPCFSMPLLTHHNTYIQISASGVKSMHHSTSFPVILISISGMNISRQKSSNIALCLL